MTYPLSAIEGLSAYCASKLKSQGIRTTDALLEAARNVKGRKALAAKTGISDIQQIARELFRFGRDKIGADEMGEIIAGTPGLSQFA